jgi:hypothetical protein
MATTLANTLTHAATASGVPSRCVRAKDASRS